jgi:hypothetical protein
MCEFAWQWMCKVVWESDGRQMAWVPCISVRSDEGGTAVVIILQHICFAFCPHVIQSRIIWQFVMNIFPAPVHRNFSDLFHNTEIGNLLCIFPIFIMTLAFKD